MPADFDGDGRTDIAAYQPSTNPADPSRWVILRSSDGAGQLVPFGGSSHIPAPRDYDGDGRADIATFTNGVWFVLSSSTGAGAATPFGAPGDVALPSPLVPYRIPGLAPSSTAVAAAAAAAPAAGTVRAAAVAPRRRPRPARIVGATDFGRAAAGLAAGSSSRPRRAAGPGPRRRVGPARRPPADARRHARLGWPHHGLRGGGRGAGRRLLEPAAHCRPRPPSKGRPGGRPAGSAAPPCETTSWPTPWINWPRPGPMGSSPASAADRGRGSGLRTE